MADHQDVPNAVQRSHRILASYPLASTTPTSHVSRHLHTMTIGAPPPYTLHQQPAYTNQYQPEINYLASYQAPGHNSAYWQSATNDASTYLGINHSQAYEYPSSNQWFAGQPPTTYTPNAFSHALFYPNYAASAYPTPPPPPRISSSSSSLAFALGRPPDQPPARPQDSPAFINEFITRKAADLRINTTSVSPDPIPEVPACSRPDALAATPRKRKPVQQLQSPHKKRIARSHTPENQELENFSTPRSHGSMYVDIPPAPYLTPSSSRTPSSRRRSREPDASSDTLDSRHDEDSFMSPPPGVVKDSARRTGDRDDRAPLDKLRSFFEDVFEAEDSLDPGADLSQLSDDHFSPLSASGSQPRLHAKQIRKLTKLVEQVGRSSRGRAGALNAARSKGRLTELETVVLARVLKILDRSVRAGESLSPFKEGSAEGAPMAVSSPVKKSTKKGKNKADDADTSEDQVSLTLDDTSHDKFEDDLETINEAILAADCCMALLSSDRLPKELYSEELIASILQTVKNLLEKVIYPVFEAGEQAACVALHHLLKPLPGSKCTSRHREALGQMHQNLLALLPRFVSLIAASTIAMSDSIIIQAVYIAIGPFFVVEQAENKKDDIGSQTFGKSAMRGLRLEALSLIRSVFAHHQEQRGWIIEEILSSLIKLSDTRQKAGQFKLRDGRSIRTVSALLLQLIQTSVHDVRLEAIKIGKMRQQQNATLRGQESMSTLDAGPSEGFDSLDRQEIGLYYGGLESATKAAKSIVLFLNQRSGKGKTTKNSNEAEYRAIFDALMSDVLVVLYWPEWPAASLLLNIASKFMVSSLDDVKAATTDNNAARSTALDHLGVIAARIRSSTLAVQARAKEFGHKPLKSMDEIVSDQNVEELRRLIAQHKEVWRYLDKQASEDRAYDSARELSTVIFAQELSSALKSLGLTDNDEAEIAPTSFAYALKSTVLDVWKRNDGDVFESSSQEDGLRTDQLAKDVGSVQGLTNSFQPILSVVLHALDAPIIFMRTKALKALGQIVGSDQSVLAAVNVRQAIEVHLLDSSPAVRDAAVELIGKYALESRDVAESYWEKIADRVVDTAISVRKRVIKLLRTFYSATSSVQRRADIAYRLVQRISDEDTAVKDLALKTLYELWFEDRQLPPNTTRARSFSHGVDDTDLVDKVAVIMGVSANFKDRHSALEELLQSVIATSPTSTSQFTQICQTLVDSLVDATDAPGFTVPNCIRTIYLFVSVHPGSLSSTNASILLPYLKSTSNVDELQVVDYLLKIFRSIIPQLPKTCIKFGQELQQILQPMIIKPANSGGVQTLQEVVACMCTVVKHLTHDYSRLVSLLKSCDARLQVWVKKPDGIQLEGPESRTLSILIFIVSLLAENFDFETVRHQNAAIKAELGTVSEKEVIEHVYFTLLRLHSKCGEGAFKGRILQCLGFLFNARPSLMIEKSSSNIMDEIFDSPDELARGRLLKILRDFLVSEYDKQSAAQKGSAEPAPRTGKVNMDELIGNTDGFAESGVASAVVQRYIDHILRAALSPSIQLQMAAVDILTFTIRQGLAHPLQSFPIIVALETSDNDYLSGRASALHSLLHTKHTSLLNSRYLDCARTAFNYLVSRQPQDWKGYRVKPTPTAVLQRWYTLLREKRSSRLDFLKALVKALNVDASLKSSQSDIDFARYMAENFSTLEYKTQEEVFTVVKHLTSVLSTTGLQVLHIISPGGLLSQLHPITLEPQDTSNLGGCPPDVVRSSVTLGIVVLLKSHLKAQYGLTEEKCSKFTMGKKTAQGDRPAVRKHSNPISWQRLRFSEVPLQSERDFNSQKSVFVQLWHEDGVVVESDESDVPPV